jgi:hypothetical protein
MTATIIEFPQITHTEAWELFRQHHEWLTKVQGFTFIEFMRLPVEERLEWLYAWDAEKAEKLRIYMNAVYH